eukprot:scpid77104/ scgid4138/ 
MQAHTFVHPWLDYVPGIGIHELRKNPRFATNHRHLVKVIRKLLEAYECAHAEMERFTFHPHVIVLDSIGCPTYKHTSMQPYIYTSSHKEEKLQKLKILF